MRPASQRLLAGERGGKKKGKKRKLGEHPTRIAHTAFLYSNKTPMEEEGKKKRKEGEKKIKFLRLAVLNSLLYF